MNFRYRLIVSTILFTLAVFPSVAQTYDHGAIFSLVEENDLIVSTDRHYTQGIKISYLHSDGFLPGFTTNLYERIPTFAFDKKVGKFGYEIGQNIYTPADISVPTLTLNDRPYAGWLYTGLILQRRGETRAGHSVLESFQLDLGVVGPWSLAKEAQTWVHQLRGFGLPQGWTNQIHNEPGVELKYQRSMRFRAQCGAADFDLIPHAGFDIGTVEDTARIGGMFRAGVNVPDDYGIQTIDSLTTASGGYSKSQDTLSRWGAYVFAGSEGRIVGWNTFLNGNLYHQSHHVDPEFLVADLKIGFAVVLNRLEIGFTYVLRTKEFHGQSENDRFGSAFVKLKF